MGAFAEILHMPPRDVEALSVAEFEGLAEYVERRIKWLTKT
jgi:hypothetical protein